MNAPRRHPPLRELRRTDARGKVLSEWRGVDWQELETRQASPTKSASELVHRVVANLGLDQRRSEAEIVRVWNHSMDPAIVAHAQPAGLRRGTLRVHVDSSVWLNEIVRYRRKEILERLQNAFGPDLIAKISFRIGG